MKMAKHNELPKHKGTSMVSLLYTIISETATITQNGGQFEITTPLNAACIVFSDRPHRIAKPVNGGIAAFVAIFNHSDFVKNPPNVALAGQHTTSGQEEYTVFEMGPPKVNGQQVSFPIIQFNGDEKPVNTGEYKNLSLVVDDSDFWDAVEDTGAILGTAATCSVGEVATVGADTAGCVAAATATTGLVGNQVNDRVS